MAEKINRDSLSLSSSIHASTESTSTAENDDGTESAMSEYDIDEYENENEEVDRGRDDQQVSNEEISSNEDNEMEEDDEDVSSSDYMDVTKCEEKRNEFTEGMKDLHEQYDMLCEKLYQERMVQIESQRAEVLDDSDPEYLQRIGELQTNMKNRMETNLVLRKLKMTSIHSKFEAEQLATQQNYQSEKILLYEKMWEKIERKIRVLEELQENSANVENFSTTGIWRPWTKPTNSVKKSSRLGSRPAEPMDPDQRNKPVIVKGPYIVYMLRENEIVDDWAAIRKSLVAQRKVDDESSN